MSKIGTKTIEIPSSVTIDIDKKNIDIQGPEGELKFILPKDIDIKRNNNILTLNRLTNEKKNKSLHGLYRQLIYNAIVGVVKPWEKKLEIVGTGFNVKLQGEDLVFRLGYSHLVTFKKVIGIKFRVEGNNKVVVSGPDKQLVGQVAYQVKSLRKPDVYKGKGIRFEGEKIRIKPGKKAKAVGSPA